MSDWMGSFLRVAGPTFRYPSSMIWRRGRRRSEPTTLVRLESQASVIVCPTAVIALLTVQF